MTANGTKHPTRALYGAALDDIYALRGGAAYEAGQLRSLTQMRTLPKTAAVDLQYAADILTRIAHGLAAETNLEQSPGRLAYCSQDSDLDIVSNIAWEKAAAGRVEADDHPAPVEHYRRALQEMAAARELLAALTYVLGGIPRYAATPVTVSKAIDAFTQRAQRAVAGEPQEAYFALTVRTLQGALRSVGAPVNLTIGIFEGQR